MRATSVPVLETERLLLTEHRKDDLEACAAMWADPLVVRFIGGRAFTRTESWTKILRYAGLWHVLGYGYWAARDRATGAFVGELGFADFQRDMTPKLDAPEAGWAFTSAAAGRGLATEALSAALAWSDSHLGRTTCIVSTANVPSIRVAEKCGYRESVRFDYSGDPTILFHRG